MNLVAFVNRVLGRDHGRIAVTSDRVRDEIRERQADQERRLRERVRSDARLADLRIRELQQ